MNKAEHARRASFGDAAFLFGSRKTFYRRFRADASIGRPSSIRLYVMIWADDVKIAATLISIIFE